MGRETRLGVGVNARDTSDNVFNVMLSDPRILEAGLNPNDFLGKGLSEEELTRRLNEKKNKASVTVGSRKKG